MHMPITYLFRVLAIVLAFASLGAPSRAVAQVVAHTHCYVCDLWDESPPGEPLFECDPDKSIFGYQRCELSNHNTTCTASSTRPDNGKDCYVEEDWIFPDGRASAGLELEPEPWTQVVGRSEVARHGCIGAIIQRRYSSARIAEMRSGLRRVTI